MGGREVVIRTHMDRRDKYGRWLAVVRYVDGAGAWRDLNEGLVADALAAQS